ncbi:NUDIX domain-containing protein [Corynebacterium sp. ES2794-CONJ1]|uniref:NUDIX hydrolase n=1 Tax=unclassified Corynebacterium TaxID=2624378 RepID=UPI00216978D0|nr:MULTISPECIES: NUDIX domain-containing protein [unclassified Corynebacterium]MCS4490771.1 NUDIX domain-containing protein [Corynebacterium sp. ES2775-CONJ]MCS4492409.1 NUDIX domain-containing protein [Corynebacterium sp. ES2715-CONJ3]MCS4532676.1 NUDIX domain-containing protein [Corynebacterium sp. ES2730-CONJ]MCU9518710.1 NUDIX domain-containing protein [Corynebacterium sp. ES2794-CONJ1]
MATPDFIHHLRQSVGHEMLWLPGVTAVVIKDVPPGAPIHAVPEVLLIKRADDGQWTPVTGICEPGEQPHHAAIREVKEETGIDVRVEALLGVGATQPIEYPNGDKCTFMDTAMRLSVIGDEVPVVNDDETTEVGWFSVMQMPRMQPRFRLVIGDAVAQLRRPEGFKPRMGYVKRDRAR